ncbi:MAG TPA: helix-hairpin-helix domain-containing protein, partial [Candidatus Saccharimonadales bacterium]|nr:helix-hairpin-helix domain-containing protein [Candidatus Saccharimonadales bacterium]
MRAPFSHRQKTGQRGSILIIVLWVSFGLVSMALYFAHAMSLEMKAADNEAASVEADQAIEGAAIYVSNVLATLQTPNMLPTPDHFRADNVKIGNATFWLIGRDTNDLETSAQGDHPIWGLVDEASKVNLNTATAAMLQNLPQMTANTAAAMFDWGSTNSTTPSTGGAKSETYSALEPPYLCKNARYETVEELRLVFGMNMDFLFGEDANLNGLLDPNENDGMVLPPYDNQDGILDPGLLEYVTTFTRESTIASNGMPRIAVNNVAALTAFIQSNYPSLSPYMAAFGGGAAATGRGGTTGGRTTGPLGRGTTGGRGAATTTSAAAPTSVLQFYVVSGMPETDFQQIEPFLMNPTITGLINVNTATATALSCIPGIGLTMAPQILSYRQSNPPLTPSISWLKTALGSDPVVAAQVGPYVTPYSYQFTADVAAVGHHGRGYRRVKFVFDCSSGTPLIIYR